MKCTQCGNTSFIENVRFPYKAIEGGNVVRDYKIYVCDQCGHAEHFYLSLIQKKKELEEAEKEFTNSVKKQKKIIAKYENCANNIQNKIKTKVKNEIDRLTAIINNKNNSVLVYEKAVEDLNKIKDLSFEDRLKLVGLSLADYPDDYEWRKAMKGLKKSEREYKEVVKKINLKYRW